MNNNTKKPVVLVLAGHDPSGGAGIQADIESITTAGCHATTLITALTAQNTKHVSAIIPQQPESFVQQIQLVLDDYKIAACKIGMIGSAELIKVIGDVLSQYDFPVVLDPVMCSTSGKSFVDDGICENILSLLLPRTTIITPNANEIRKLTQLSQLDEAANKLLGYGTQSILITGTDEPTKKVINTFYFSQEEPVHYEWQRLGGSFHGSGCTLSARIAALLAHNKNIKTAVKEAQEYTWNALKHGLTLGQGQMQPNRFFGTRFYAK